MTGNTKAALPAITRASSTELTATDVPGLQKGDQTQCHNNRSFCKWKLFCTSCMGDKGNGKENLKNIPEAEVRDKNDSLIYTLPESS